MVIIYNFLSYHRKIRDHKTWNIKIKQIVYDAVTEQVRYLEIICKKSDYISNLLGVLVPTDIVSQRYTL